MGGPGRSGEALQEIVQIEDQAPHLIGQRFAEFKARHPDDWYQQCTTYCQRFGKKPWSLQHVNNMMRYSAFVEHVLEPMGSKQLPAERLIRPLAALPTPDQMVGLLTDDEYIEARQVEQQGGNLGLPTSVVDRDLPDQGQSRGFTSGSLGDT